MNNNTAAAEKQIQITISQERAERLNQLAAGFSVSEDRLVEKALDLLFTLTDLLNGDVERSGWHLLSVDALRRVWDNEADAVYDNIRSSITLARCRHGTSES